MLWRGRTRKDLTWTALSARWPTASHALFERKGWWICGYISLGSDSCLYLQGVQNNASDLTSGLSSHNFSAWTLKCQELQATRHVLPLDCISGWIFWHIPKHFMSWSEKPVKLRLFGWPSVKGALQLGFERNWGSWNISKYYKYTTKTTEKVSSCKRKNQIISTFVNSREGCHRKKNEIFKVFIPAWKSLNNNIIDCPSERGSNPNNNHSRCWLLRWVWAWGVFKSWPY